MNVNVIKNIAKQLAMTIPVLALALFLFLSPSLKASAYALTTSDHGLKTPDLTLKTPDFTLKTPDHALKTPDLTLKTPDHALNTSGHTLKTPAQARAKAPEETTIILAQASVSEGQAASMAKSKYGGKVLSVSKSGSGGRVVYRVKLLLDSGRVIIVTVDGQTGRVSG